MGAPNVPALMQSKSQYHQLHVSGTLDSLRHSNAIMLIHSITMEKDCDIACQALLEYDRYQDGGHSVEYMREVFRRKFYFTEAEALEVFPDTVADYRQLEQEAYIANKLLQEIETAEKQRRNTKLRFRLVIGGVIIASVVATPACWMFWRWILT